MNIIDCLYLLRGFHITLEVDTHGGPHRNDNQKTTGAKQWNGNTVQTVFSIRLVKRTQNSLFEATTISETMSLCLRKNLEISDVISYRI
jgi:hypothetical protein